MTVILNGKTFDLETGSTVRDLLLLLNLLDTPIAVELNGGALTRQEYSSSILADGSRIEVIRLAAGG